MSWDLTSYFAQFNGAEMIDFKQRLDADIRAARERAGALKSLMVETQRRLVGDTLEEGGEDPYFWASKLHFYITGTTFYNFPYTFGFLLSRGLFSLWKNEGSKFLPRYENFLRLAGSDTAENVARRTIGRDLESPAFWSEAIASLEEPTKRFEELVPKTQVVFSS